MQIRIGYPLNGQAGGNIGNNFVNYTFIGNPNAPRPDVSDQEDISIGTPTDPAIAGMNLIWQDEFNGTTLDTSKWNYETGYYLNNDPGTWGWGNAELQHYTNSTQNVYVQDGKLNIKAMNDSKSFPQDPNRYAQYSSGKINTKDKLSLKYGRVDFVPSFLQVMGYGQHCGCFQKIRYTALGLHQVKLMLWKREAVCLDQ